MKSIIYLILCFIPLGMLSAEQNLAITIPPDSSRIYANTNKIDAFWAGETNDYHTSRFHGLTYRKQPIFRDFYIFVDGQLLDRSNADAVATPIALARKYVHAGISEQIVFPDNKHILVLQFSSPQVHQITIVPGFNVEPATDIQYPNLAKIIQSEYKTPADLPITEWIAADKPGEWSIVDSTLLEQISAGSIIRTPIQWRGRINPSDTLSVFLSFAVDRTTAAAERKSWREGISMRQSQIREKEEHPVTDNSDVNKALLWARANMTALIMQQSGTGIYAGLPWFDDYWGRDTFISLPGATLTNNDYEDAKAILRSFASFQIKDSTNQNFGRIPNRVAPGEKMYNTTGATLWFIQMIDECIRYSGDFAFADEMFSVIRRSIEGALKYHSTPDGLMVHGDAETWMDAVGPGGPWSPRGNRSVEIQVLWYRQLETGVKIAQFLGHDSIATKWQQIAGKVALTFRTKYWDDQQQQLYDHLNADDTPDTSKRPNQAFAVSLSKELLMPSKQGDVLRAVIVQTTYPWGVASLAQTDPNFHPYHQYRPYYPKDAAYHNGIIWTWLSGPVIDGLTRFGEIDHAYTLTEDLTEKILYRGMAGSIAEVTDAMPVKMPENPGDVRADDIRLSGTFSQAWSLAEYLRTWWQDYFGIHPDAFNNTITLFPQLPVSVNRVNTICAMGSSQLSIGYQANEDEFVYTLQNIGQPVTMQLNQRIGDTIYSLDTPFHLAQLDVPVKVVFSYQTRTFYLENESITTTARPARFKKEDLNPIHFVTPKLQPNLKAFQRPDHPLLDGVTATKHNPDAREIFSVSGPVGDDYGPNQSYNYPASPQFENGILDLTNFRVSYDDSTVYLDLDFANLVQPGWHPEYGFQLTYVAIGISDGSGEGIRQFGQNAQYQSEVPLKYTIYIGGGFQIVDSSGNIVAEYIPTKTGYPMADLSRNRIHIAIPKQFLPQPKKWWKYTVLVGAQDDHGGAGLGAFLAVGSKWANRTGGGKKDASLPNWYDIMKVGY